MALCSQGPLTLHYHGTPITPHSAIVELRGKCFCVSFAAPQQIEVCHQIGQSVLLDNGAFSAWKRGIELDWNEYFKWCDPWLDYPTTYAIIPDSIEGGVKVNDKLIKQWPHGDKGWPVWHLHEPIERINELLDKFPKIAFGSSAEYKDVGSSLWRQRIDDAFDFLAQRSRRLPWVHMLRGMSVVGKQWPFASVDSTDVGRNHNRRSNPGEMAKDWDSMQCPGRWQVKKQKRFFKF